MLLKFVFAISALFLSVKYIHKRKILSLFNSANKLDWKRILWGTIVWFVLLAIIEYVLYIVNPENYTFREPDSSYVFLIIISLVILPIQTTFEEVFTRGYILQSVTYNSKRVFLGFIISIIVFMLLHGMNPETSEYGFTPMMTYYFSAALLLGLIVVYDRRLEIAIGVHTATNIFGALIVTYKGAALQTDSLFITSRIDPMVLAFEFLILGAIFLIISGIVYKWDPVESFKYNARD
jgi:membrane protease YdiL (CAAX protease family)